MQQPDISAGTLLSKTHEELILLLIQLRRQVDMKERGMARRLKDIQTIQVPWRTFEVDVISVAIVE